MSESARDPDPTGVRIEAHARDNAQVYVSGRDIYVTQSGSETGDEHDPYRGTVDALRAFTGPLLLFCGCAVLIGAVLFGPGDPGGGLATLALLAAGLTGLLMALGLMRRRYWLWQEIRLLNSPALMRRHDRRLDRTARHLARALRSQWEAEERLRKVQHPSPLPVRWTTEDRLSDHWSSVRGDAECDTPLDLSGDFASVTDTYARVPSGRLLVVGGPGAGKSVLALRFALNHLHRAEPGDRIPVILPPASWDPAGQDLESWAAARLMLDHSWLAARTARGTTLAAELLRTGRLLPVLDGFDEIRSEARPEAMRRLRASLGHTDPVVVTTRGDEFDAAVASAGFLLPATAAVRLLPLSLDHVAEHLRRTTRKMVTGDLVSTKWDPVFVRLRASAGDVHVERLRNVLTTPLMASLARTAYSETTSDPSELLNRAAYPTERSLEDHLLDRLIPAVYDPPEQATRWLEFLAQRLDAQDTQDLAWWQLSRRAAGALRTLGVMSALAVSVAVMWWLFVDTPVSWFFGLPVWVPVGLMGLVSVAEVALGQRERLSLPRHFRPPASTGRFLLGAAAGLALILACGLWLFSLFDTGVILTLVLVVYAASLSTILHPAVPMAAARSPRWVLRQDRRATVASLGLGNLWAGGAPCLRAAVPLLFPVVALMTWKDNAGRDAVGPVDWSVSVTASIAALAVFAVSVSAWGTFTAARVWPWLSGQIPWALMDFLEDAHRRGVLRQSGAYYQFRHARLQKWLALRAASQAPQPSPARPAPAPAQRPRRQHLAAVGTRARGARFSLWSLVFLASLTVSSISESEGPPGPRVAIKPACELLNRHALTPVLPEPRILGGPGSVDRGNMCLWLNARSVPEASVQVDVTGSAPFLRYSAVQWAEKSFQSEVRGKETKYDPPTSNNVHKPQYTGHPEGLGEEAFTVIHIRDTAMTETVVRVDNVVLVITYIVSHTRDDDETLARLARATEDLARAAVSSLGPRPR
ncbi:NACHT domain-containing protein [Streptomyces scopuliridis]|uniref:NACHT domain-containing protein n=1 Tax=Streptomyces scopuliridis TaxID=452529 RepID=UPI0036D0B9BC